MKCTHCRERDATHHFNLMRGRTPVTRDLCDLCAGVIAGGDVDAALRRAREEAASKGLAMSAEDEHALRALFRDQ